MNPEAGDILAAVDAIQSRATFNRGQVVHLVALAYEMGQRHGHAEDVAETVGCWAEHAEPRQTREERVALRMAEMTLAVPELTLDDPDWPPVAVPGTVDLAELQSIWHCPCPRDQLGRHVVGRHLQVVR